jgi:hypothetical protein
MAGNQFRMASLRDNLNDIGADIRSEFVEVGAKVREDFAHFGTTVHNNAPEIGAAVCLFASTLAFGASVISVSSHNVAATYYEQQIEHDGEEGDVLHHAKDLPIEPTLTTASTDPLDLARRHHQQSGHESLVFGTLAALAMIGSSTTLIGLENRKKKAAPEPTERDQATV